MFLAFTDTDFIQLERKKSNYFYYEVYFSTRSEHSGYIFANSKSSKNVAIFADKKKKMEKKTKGVNAIEKFTSPGLSSPPPLPYPIPPELFCLLSASEQNK